MSCGNTLKYAVCTGWPEDLIGKTEQMNRNHPKERALFLFCTLTIFPESFNFRPPQVTLFKTFSLFSFGLSLIDPQFYQTAAPLTGQNTSATFLSSEPYENFSSCALQVPISPSEWDFSIFFQQQNIDDPFSLGMTKTSGSFQKSCCWIQPFSSMCFSCLQDIQDNQKCIRSASLGNMDHSFNYR